MGTLIEHGRPVRRPEVWMRQAGKENALYNPTSGEVHLLNYTARAIWDLCDGETQPEEMITAICDVSGLPREIVVEDVERILTDFIRTGLIDWKR